jgi:hypothetical protein
VPAQTQQTHVQRLSLKNRGGLTLYTLASRLQKQKARSNSYMVIFNFIGYFILVLRDFSPPHCYVTLLMFGFLRFYLSAMPSLPPCYFLRPTLFSSDHPPCYSAMSPLVSGVLMVKRWVGSLAPVHLRIYAPICSDTWYI